MLQRVRDLHEAVSTGTWGSFGGLLKASYSHSLLYTICPCSISCGSEITQKHVSFALILTAALFQNLIFLSELLFGKWVLYFRLLASLFFLNLEVSNHIWVLHTFWPHSLLQVTSTLLKVTTSLQRNCNIKLLAVSLSTKYFIIVHHYRCCLLHYNALSYLFSAWNPLSHFHLFEVFAKPQRQFIEFFFYAMTTTKLIILY